MEKHIGEEYDGIVSSVVSFGLFVELPNLPYMTQEIRLFEFSRLNLTTSNFLFKNITKRHFYFSTLIRSSLFYGRYKRVGNLIASLSLFSLTLSLLLTYDEDVIINEYKGIQYLVGYTIVAICVSSTIIQFLSLLFYVNDIEMRRLYNIAKVNKGITILKEYEDLQSKYIWKSNSIKRENWKLEYSNECD